MSGSQAPTAELLDLLSSHRVTAAILVAAKLGVADALSGGPKTCATLAAICEAHEPSLRRLIAALVTIGICRQVEHDQFELTALGAPLSANADPSLKAWAIFEGETLWKSWGGLIDTIRTGKTRAELAGGGDSFQAMALDPAAVDMFNAAMVSFTRLVARDVLTAYDFTGAERIMDVGGGNGELLVRILKAYPTIKGTVLDLAQCEPGARALAAEAGVEPRTAFVAGDFFREVPPGADMIILKSIVHDWDDARCAILLTNCRKALPKVGMLLLIERSVSPEPGVSAVDRANALSDLNMLRGPGGRERTEREYRELLAAAGFTISRVLPAGRYHVIEAAPQQKG